MTDQALQDQVPSSLTFSPASLHGSLATSQRLASHPGTDYPVHHSYAFALPLSGMVLPLPLPLDWFLLTLLRLAFTLLLLWFRSIYLTICVALLLLLSLCIIAFACVLFGSRSCVLYTFVCYKCLVYIRYSKLFTEWLNDLWSYFIFHLSLQSLIFESFFSLISPSYLEHSSTSHFIFSSISDFSLIYQDGREQSLKW